MTRLVALGLRLTWSAGRAGRLRVTLMASGSAVAAFVILTALALTGVADRQQERVENTALRRAPAANTSTSLRGEAISDGWNKRELRRVVLAVVGPDAPVPPGLDRLPRAGEVALSPALAGLVRTEPLVALRFPQRPVENISSDGLVEPGQLLAYVGVAPNELQPAAWPISGFGDPSAKSKLNPGAARTISLLLLLTLVVPVLMFMVTCARLSATARDQRLAALRLIGLSPRKTQVVNASETGLVGLAGGAIGFAAWLIWRYVDPSVRTGTFGWYSTDLRLAPGLIVAALLALVLLGVAVGALASRASIARPLRTRREQSVRTISGWRAVPLVVGVTLLGLSWITSHGTSEQLLQWLVPFGAGLLATAIGLILIVPYVATATGWLLARSSRPAALLAGGRLRHEPAVAGRVVAALAVALFAAGFAQVVLVVVDTTSPDSPDAGRGPVTSLTAWGPESDGAVYRGISDLGIAIPEWQLGTVGAIAASCEELRTVSSAALPDCRDGEIYYGRAQPGRFDIDRQTDVDVALLQAGLPAARGELTFGIVYAGTGGGEYTPDVIVPPALAPPTNSRFTVPFSREAYDPQVAGAGARGIRAGRQLEPVGQQRGPGGQRPRL